MHVRSKYDGEKSLIVLKVARGSIDAWGRGGGGGFATRFWQEMGSFTMSKMTDSPCNKIYPMKAKNLAQRKEDKIRNSREHVKAKQ